LNDDGTPTSRYFDFLDQTVAPRVLAEGIREAYDDLFQVNINAQTLTKPELINKFKTLSQGQLSESVLDKMALTFSELIKLADFTASSTPKPATAAVEDAKPPGEPKKEKEGGANEVTRLIVRADHTSLAV
jgi:hypothetical protein